MLLLGDFNSEIREIPMQNFCNIFNFFNLIKSPTCYKNVYNPTCIDLILTNKPKSFFNSTTIETGLSDHHVLTITIMKSTFHKLQPTRRLYRDYKHFNPTVFRTALLNEIYNKHKGQLDYKNLEKIVIGLLDTFAPMKMKFIRANNSPFMNKTLYKAVMNRSRLRNKFLKIPSAVNRENYTRYRNYCTGLFRKEKKAYYNNLDIKKITDNKKFWKTVKPLFSEKHFSGSKIILTEGDDLISDDKVLADTFNTYFTNIVKNLDIKGFTTYDFSYNPNIDYISNIINKFKNHPSILMIKKNIRTDEPFNITPVNAETIEKRISSLDKKKSTPLNNIPTNIIVDNKDIFSPIITKIYNSSCSLSIFPDDLKYAEVTPVFKKEDRTLKSNYRPISLLPPIAKVFERDIYNQISSFIERHLSDHLCGFRKGFSTQNSLSLFLHRWQKAIDNREIAGALLTDLSKAFDCINHELLIAKLEAYGFGKATLKYIYDYLSGRKQRTNVNNTFSEWCNILFGVPQGSILGPLLFNIYMNDIFYFLEKCDLANFADDTTPYTTGKTLNDLIKNLEGDIHIMIKWFSDNFLKLNKEKCHLFMSKCRNDISINVGDQKIKNENTVKLLGVTFDNQLKFDNHVSKLCKNANNKLHALSRMSNFMSHNKLRNVMKAFIESEFNYCPLIWMFHSRKLNNQINQVHERALRLIYKDNNLTFDELLIKDKSFTIHERNLQLLAIEMFKVKNKISPKIMDIIFPERNIPFNLRNPCHFYSSSIRTVQNGSDTISTQGPKIWSQIPDEIRNSKTLSQFKNKIKNWKPKGCTCRICKTWIQGVGFI